MDIIKQSNDSTCGPCAIVHSLNLERKERDKIISDLKSMTSTKNITKKAFTEEYGVYIEDIIAYSNYKYRVNWKLNFLNMKDEEEKSSYVRRIYELLKNSHKPIIEIRAFVALACDLKKIDKNANDETRLWFEYRWFNSGAHFHVVESVQETLNENDLGFSYRFIESMTGKVETGYIYFEQYKKYTAFRDHHMTEDPQWQWLSGTPFMLVITPSIEIGETKFYQRKVVVLRAIAH